MTRKDYVALAEALREARPQTSGDAGGGYSWSLDYGEALVTVWQDCIREVSRVLAADNPRFDRDRFVRACQGESL